MTKNILKEIIIMLLLCLAIILVLGVLLYEYVPSNKVIPEKVSYIPSEQIQKDLQETVSLEDSQVILTYEVNSSDLKNYERVKDYKPGKANPFSSYENDAKKQGQSTNSKSGNTETTNNSQTSNSNNTNTNNTDSQDQNTTQEQTTNSDGSFFPDKGTK